MSATLANTIVTRGVVQIPQYGTPWIDVTLADETTLSGTQTVTLGSVAMSATVASGGADQGRSRYRLACGAGGWGAELPAKAYRDDAGVKVSRVLQDLASETGETLAGVPSALRGAHYARASGPAFVVLNELAPKAWYVGFDGVTRFGLRPAQTYTGDAPRVRIDKGARVVELALDEFDPTLVPGVIVDGNPPATDVEWEITDTRLTCRVYYGRDATAGDRFFAAVEAIVMALFPTLRYGSVYEYRVVTQSGNRYNIQPVRTQSGMPDLAGVRARPGVSGFRSTVKLGEQVLVAFIDRDPSRPCIISHDDADSEGWFPQLVEFGAGGNFVALKPAVDAIQAKLDDLIGKYNSATYPTGVGPSGTTTQPETPVGAQASAQFIKVK
jgi:hypothetical protein